MVFNLKLRKWLCYQMKNFFQLQSKIASKYLFHLLIERKATWKISLWEKKKIKICIKYLLKMTSQSIYSQESRFNLVRSNFLLLKKLKKMWLWSELQTELNRDSFVNDLWNIIAGKNCWITNVNARASNVCATRNATVRVHVITNNDFSCEYFEY